MRDREKIVPPFHYWKIRMGIGLCMIILAFVGLIVTELHQDGAWHYWRSLCLIFAALTIGMNFFLRRKEAHDFYGTLWHEILHWLGLLLAVTVVSIMVEVGIAGRFTSSITVVLLLALSTYLAGVYTDGTLLFVGLIIGGFAFGLSIISAYLYPVLIPMTAIILGCLLLYLKRQHRRHALQKVVLDRVK